MTKLVIGIIIIVLMIVAVVFLRNNNNVVVNENRSSLMMYDQESNPFTFSHQQHWRVTRNSNQYNAVKGGGPAEVLTIYPLEDQLFFDTSVSFSWYHFNPDAPLADVVPLLPNAKLSQDFLQIQETTIGSTEGLAVIIQEPELEGTESWYRSEYYLARLPDAKLLEISVFYPTQQMFLDNEKNIMEVIDSIIFR